MLEIKNLNKSFGAVRATRDVNLMIGAGGVHAIIGPNGAGKTSLINQIYGSLSPDSGAVIFAGSTITHLPPHKRVRLGLARSFQRSTVLMDFTVIESVMVALLTKSTNHDALGNWGANWGNWGGAWGSWFSPVFTNKQLRRQAEALLARLGLSGRMNALSGRLAHGEKRLLELALALVGTPKLLLLDEPMAGTGAGEAQHLAQMIKSLSIQNSCTIVLVEHDMDAVFRLADRITVMVEGGILATDTPKAISASLLVREAYLGQNA